MYKLYLNDKNQITSYSKINEAQEGDIVFSDQDLELVESYSKPVNINKFYEMEEIKRWLSENDYKVNKHSLGEYADDDPRWVEYIEQRQTKLLRYNELELLLDQIQLPVFDISLLTPIEEEIEEEFVIKTQEEIEEEQEEIEEEQEEITEE
jgi:hypothetical protein